MDRSFLTCILQLIPCQMATGPRNEQLLISLNFLAQGFSNLPARQICWQERLFKLAGEVFSKKSLPLKKNHYQFFSKSLPIFQKITSVPMILKKSLLNHCCMITWKKSVVIFFSKNFLGSDFFGARKNGSDFLALLKKFENPCSCS